MQFGTFHFSFGLSVWHCTVVAKILGVILQVSDLSDSLSVPPFIRQCDSEEHGK